MARSGDQFSRRIELTASFDASSIIDGLKQIRDVLSQSGSIKGKGMLTDVNTQLSQIERSYENLRAQAQKGFSSESEALSFEKGLGKLQDRISIVRDKLQEIQSVSLRTRTDDAEKDLRRFEGTIEKTRKSLQSLIPQGAGFGIDQIYNENSALQERLKLIDEEIRKRQQLLTQQRESVKNAALGDLGAIPQHKWKEMGFGWVGDISTEKVSVVRQSFNNLLRQFGQQGSTDAEAFVAQFRQNMQGTLKDTDELSKHLEQIRERLQWIQNQRAQLTTATLDQTARKQLGSGYVDYGKQIQDLQTLRTEVENNDRVLQNYAQTTTRVQQSLNADNQALNGLNQNFNSVNSQINVSKDSWQKLSTELAKNVTQQTRIDSGFAAIINRLQYFFSATTLIYQFRNQIRATYNDVKTLDKSFAEIAMVTTKTVDDLWASYNDYAQMANRLGQSTNDVVQASALFYQQGLQTAEALELTEETMKLATLAGADFAEATDLMTAAIRGFRMEMDAGAHVTDVYSELAAHAAASVQEIAVAMNKTAAIANSAGMSFENTAAFLTQMIETTQESANNIGTALKTVIARFTELKENVDESDESFEDMDFNKVDKALKSVGIALKDSNGQFRDLDDVFMELSSIWGGLSRNTQRYIATQAAGSRQQSRFIALMDNYARTVELVDIAQNSAGRSTEQFNKYMDSIEYSVKRLQNTWEQFRVSIADSKFYNNLIKGATTLLEKISDFSGADWGKVALVFFTVGQRAFQSFLLGMREAANGFSGVFSSMIQKATMKGSEIQNSMVRRMIFGTSAMQQAEALRASLPTPIADEYKQLTTQQEQLRQDLENAEGLRQQAMEDRVRAATQVKETTEHYKKVKEEQDSLMKATAKSQQGAQLRAQWRAAGLKISTREALKESLAIRQIKTVDPAERAMQEANNNLDKAGKRLDDANREVDRIKQAISQNQEKTRNFDSKAMEDEAKKNADQEAENKARADKIIENQKGVTLSYFNTLGAVSGAAFTGAFASAMMTDDPGVVFRNTLISGGTAAIPQVINSFRTAFSAAYDPEGLNKSFGASLLKGLGAGAISLGISALVTGAIAIAARGWKTFKKNREERQAAYRLEHDEVYALRQELEELNKTEEETGKKAGEATTKVNEQAKELGDLKTAVQKASELQKKALLTADDKAQYLEISNQIKELAPELVSGYDAEGNAVLALGNAYDELTKKKEKALKDAEVEADRASLANAVTKYESAVTERNLLSEEINQLTPYFGGISLSDIDQQTERDLIQTISSGDTHSGYVLHDRDLLEKSQFAKHRKIATRFQSIILDLLLEEVYKGTDDKATEGQYGGILKQLFKDVNNAAIKELNDVAETDYLKNLFNALQRIGYNSPLEGQKLEQELLGIIQGQINNLESLDQEIITSQKELDKVLNQTYKDLFQQKTLEDSQFKDLDQNALDSIVYRAESLLGSQNIDKLKEKWKEEVPDADLNDNAAFANWIKDIYSKTLELPDDVIQDIKKVYNQEILDNFEKISEALQPDMTMGQVLETVRKGLQGSNSEKVYEDYILAHADQIALYNETATKLAELLGQPDSLQSVDITDSQTGERISVSDFESGTLGYAITRMGESASQAIQNKLLELDEKQPLLGGAFIEALSYSLESLPPDALAKVFNSGLLDQLSKINGQYVRDQILNLFTNDREKAAFTEMWDVLFASFVPEDISVEAEAEKIEETADGIIKSAQAYEKAAKSVLEDGYIDASALKTLRKAGAPLSELFNSEDGTFKTDTARKWISDQIDVQNQIVTNLRATAETKEDLEAVAEVEATIIALYGTLATVDKAIKESEEKKADAIEKANKAIEDSYKSLIEKQQDLVDKQKALNEALYGTSTHKINNSELYNYQTAIDSFTDSIDNAQKKLEKLEGESPSEYLDKWLSSTRGQKAYLLAENDRYANAIGAVDSALREQLQGYLTSKGYGSNVDNFYSYSSELDRYLINFGALMSAQVPDQIKDGIAEQVQLMNEYRTSIVENENKIKELEDAFKEYRRKLRDDYVDVQNEVVEKLKESYEKEIEDKKELYEGMKKADDDYLDALEKAIDKQRKLRETEEKWNDLSQKEKRLSLISRDTSGSQRRDQLKLQKEIEKDRTEMLDDTVDSIIDQLKELYEEQEKSRNAEVEYQEAVLDNANLVQEANAIINSWKSMDEMTQWMWEHTEGIEKMSDEAVEKLTEDWQSMFDTIQTYNEMSVRNVEGFLEISGLEIQDIVVSTSESITSEASRAISELTMNVDSAIASATNAVTAAMDALTEAQTKYNEAIKEMAELAGQKIGGFKPSETESLPANLKDIYNLSGAAFEAAAKSKIENYLPSESDSKDDILTYIAKLKRKGFKNLTDTYQKFDPEDIPDIDQAQALQDRGYKLFRNKTGTEVYMTQMSDFTLQKMFETGRWKAYKKGGLVDYTGPAWVDGTKAKPESFLNATDTARIAEAANIFESIALRGSNGTLLSGLNATVGDTNVELHFHIDSIATEQQVDYLIDRVKEEVVEAANPIGSTVFLHQ